MTLRAEKLIFSLPIVKRGEKPWPVVIMDEQMLQRWAKDFPRPLNARLSDGTWPEEYLPGGSKQGKVMYPTLRLITLKV